MFRGLIVGQGRVAKDDQVFSTVGSTSFTVPDNVHYISAVCVGGGGGSCSGHPSSARGAGAGGDLVYGTISVTPGETLTIVVGDGGTGAAYSSSTTGGHGGSSGVKRGSSFLLRAKGGKGGGNSSSQDTSLVDSAVTNSGQNSGGISNTSGAGGLGGGGAAGYSGDGGDGGSNVIAATNGAGGAGGGGAYSTYIYYGGFGGGVHLYGEGSSGSAGVNSNDGTVKRGGDGSSNADDIADPSYPRGGGAGAPFSSYSVDGLDGDNGGVRLVWPGQSSFFPSTDVGEP